MKSYVIYIIECRNGSYYTGYTTDIERRYAEHVAGSIKCKYTRANPPRKLAAFWEFTTTLSNILRLEKAVKKLSTQEKHALVTNKEHINKIIQNLEILDII